MALTYTPLRDRSSYLAALGGNPRRVADFNNVWRTVSAIDLQNLIIRYNSLEYSGNVTDLTNLRNDIDVALSSVESVRHAYTDADVLAPANDMRMRLSSVRSATESRIRYYNSSLGRSKIGKAVNTAKRGMNKVVKAYKAVTKPAHDLYDVAEKAVDTGGANIYEAIGKIGKRK